MPRFALALLCGSIASHSLLTSASCGFQESAGASNPPAISTITERVRPFVSGKEVSGAVTLVATPDRVVHLDATGEADIEERKPMAPDTIFWIASMTKPVTATAVLMLQDEGKLSVDDPVEKHLPEFKGLKSADGKPVRVTIRHLLTHTSGMGEISPDEARGIKDLAGLIPLYVGQARPVRAGIEVGLLPVRDQHRGPDRRGRLGRGVRPVRRAAAVRPAGDEGHDLLPHRGATPPARHALPPHRGGRTRGDGESSSSTARPRRAATGSRRRTAGSSPPRRTTPGSAR